MNKSLRSWLRTTTRNSRLPLVWATLLSLGLFLPMAATATATTACHADGGHAPVSIGDGMADEDAGTVTFAVTCNPCGAVNATFH